MKKVIIILLFLMFVSFVWADLCDELIQAAEDGNWAEVERLIEAGADVNVQNNYGNIALMYAAEGYIEIVELLINAGATE